MLNLVDCSTICLPRYKGALMDIPALEKLMADPERVYTSADTPPGQNKGGRTLRG